MTHRSTRLATMLLAAAALIPATGVPLRAQSAAPATAGATTQAAERGFAYVPAPKPAETFAKQHASFVERAKEGDVDLLFLGDSITAGWRGKGKAVFEKYYSKYKTANFGIGGDGTQHVLWRIQNGELEGIKPKVVVLMIGTNNTGGRPAGEIARGVQAILDTIKEKTPESKVLLLAVFPRGPRTSGAGKKDDGVRSMQVIGELNPMIEKMADGKRVRYLNINDKFLVDGKIPDDVMPDQLHPNEKGYEIWAEAMDPLLTEMMK